MSSSATPPFPTFPASAKKIRQTYYWFEDDIADLNRYFDLRTRGAAVAGKRLPYTKTEFIRDLFHKFMNERIRPELAKLEAGASSAQSEPLE